MSDLLKRMKERIKNSGTNKKEVFYLGPEQKKRIRFLQEFDTGYEFNLHNHYERGIQALCLEELGGDCPYCSDSDIPNQTHYAFSVFDYDANAVRILFYKVTGATPLPAFMDYFEEKGTVMDRDYTLKKNGKGPGSTVTVMPGEVTKFRNQKVKPYSKNAMAKILAEAFPVNAEDRNDDVEEDEAPKAKSKNKDKAKKKQKTLHEKIMELETDDIKEICFTIGMSKKEIKGLDDEEMVNLLFDDYEEEDIQDTYDNWAAEQDGDDDE
jgi:hypothetical protein